MQFNENNKIQMQLREHILSKQKKQPATKKRERKKAKKTSGTSSSGSYEANSSFSQNSDEAEKVPKVPARRVQHRMFDPMSEQKRRRLETASYFCNNKFQTSSNRFVPILPASILGKKISS